MTEWTRETPWRQGSLLTSGTAKTLELLHSEFPEDTLVIVATHDCDLAQLTDKEPSVELLIGRRIPRLDGNNTHAKSARTLHMEFDGHEPVFAEFIATDKCSVPKEKLLDFEPDRAHRLSPESLTTFQAWLASRYRRSAFPDKFERILTHEKKLADRISKAVRPHGDLITAVFFDVDNGMELEHKDSDDTYTLGIILLHASEPDVNIAEAAANKAKLDIEKAFRDKLYNPQTKRWEFIELSYIDAVSDETLTYRQATLLKKWRLDHISLGADPQQPIVAD